MAETQAILKIVGKDQASAEIRKVQKSVSDLQVTANKKGGIADLFGMAQTRLGAMATGAALFYVGKEAVKAASNFEELQSKAKFVYGEAFPAVASEAGKIAESVGRASSQILQFSADFGAIIQPMGIAQAEAGKMSTRFAQLAVDMASFHNTTDVEAFVALRSAITGETEPMKRFGVVMTQANLSAFALRNGIKQKIETMNQAQMTALRYNFVLDATKQAQGDATRTAGSFANQMRRTGGEVRTLFEELGKPVLPALAKGLEGVNYVLGTVVEAIQIVKQEWASLMGLLSFGTENLKGTVGGVYFGGEEGVVNKTGLPGFEERRFKDGTIDYTKNADVRKQAEALAETQREADAAAKAAEDLAAKLKELAGNGPGGTGGAGDVKKVADAMKDLGKTFQEKVRDINVNILELEVKHKQKMGELKEQLTDVRGELSRMERDYARTVQEMLKEQEKLTKKSGKDEAKVFVDMEEKIRTLKDQIKSFSQDNPGFLNDKLITVLGNRLPENVGKDITTQEQREYNITDEQARAANLQIQLDREMAAYEKYAADRKRIEATIAEQRTFLNLTTNEQALLNVRETTAEEQKELDKRKDDEKKSFDDAKRENNQRQKDVQDLMAKEKEAFTVARQEYEKTRTAILAFETDYTTAMQNIGTVTEEVANGLKDRLAELQTTISNIDALLVSRSDVTGGDSLTSRVAERRNARMPSDSYLTPYANGGVVTRATAALIGEAGYPEAVIPMPSGNIPVKIQGGMSSGVTITIGDVHVHNEADENRLIAKIKGELARAIQLQRLAA